MKKIHTVVVSAGVGKRFGSDQPKQYQTILGKTILQYSVDALSQVVDITSCYLVISQQDTIAKNLNFALPIHWVIGGKERMHSVFNGVQAIWQAEDSQPDDWVLIHDAGRPCVNLKDVEKLIKQVQAHSAGGILAVPVRDTVKQSISTPQGLLANTTLERNQLWLAQTPQIFPLEKLYNYLQQAIKQHIPFTDEASLFEYFGEKPLLVEGSHTNIKLTYPEDLLFIKTFLQ